MKKILGLFVLMCSLVLIAGCAKKDNSERRIFAKEFVEEIEGNEIEITQAVIFNNDGTGIMCIQDTVPFKYDDEKINFTDNEIKYEYTIDGDKLTISLDGIDDVFTLSDESILAKLPDFLVVNDEEMDRYSSFQAYCDNCKDSSIFVFSYQDTMFGGQWYSCNKCGYQKHYYY